MPARDRVAEGDLVALVDERGRRTLVRAAAGPQRVAGLGVLDLAPLLDAPWGGEVAFGARRFFVFDPGFEDHAAALERGAQIVTPKDAAWLLWACDVRPGARVLEAGAGSGALTLALAHAGADVTTVEIREDHLRHARANVERAGYAARVRFVLGDVTKEAPAGPFDAALLDLPNPEDAVPIVAPALRGGGRIGVYTPLVSQAEAARRALAGHGFALARTVEVLERELVIGERGSRPAHDMLAHTAYLTTARRIL